MTLQDNALVSLGDTKIFLRISVPTYDDLLIMLINQASDYIEKRCQRSFAQDTYTERLSGDGEDTLVLTNTPVTSLTLLEENTAYDNTESWETVNDDDYFNSGSDLTAGIIRMTSTFRRGTSNYRATYVGGYATIPSDLQYAVMMIVSESFNHGGKSAGIKSESLGDHSVVFESVLTENTRVNEIIQRYRKMTIL